jgi:hypothetical protein
MGEHYNFGFADMNKIYLYAHIEVELVVMVG